MKKTWTKEEFIEEARALAHPEEPYVLEKQEKRRLWLRKKRNPRRKNAQSKLQ